MKLARHYIGKVVKLTWEDPRAGERELIANAPKGKDALAAWDEYGLIDDITDGVIRMQHSTAYNAGEKEPDEAIFTWIVEDLIKEIVVLTEWRPEEEK